VSGIIASPTEPLRKGIKVQTRLGSEIANEQCSALTALDRSNFPDLERKWPNLRSRCEPTGIFNCHGLTFASRRTRIWETADVDKMLKEDDYKLIPYGEVLPGDVIVYESDEGEFEHSGIVIESPSGPLAYPIVVSKWGHYAEKIHAANNCPYNFLKARYYRITK
jgi:hypothetical protein